MLILTRRLGEALIIGEDVFVQVREIHGNQVRIGIDAPKDIAVHREEIFRRLVFEKSGEIISLAK